MSRKRHKPQRQSVCRHFVLFLLDRQCQARGHPDIERFAFIMERGSKWRLPLLICKLSDTCHSRSQMEGLMRYQNGKEIKVGDYVAMPDGFTGKVIVSISTDEYNEKTLKPEWGLLKPGILVRSLDTSAVHYGVEYDMQADESIECL